MNVFYGKNCNEWQQHRVKAVMLVYPYNEQLVDKSGNEYDQRNDADREGCFTIGRLKYIFQFGRL